MADPNFSWIYLLIFLVIPLTRIIPRLIAKRRMQNNSTKTEIESRFDGYQKSQMKAPKPEINQENITKDKLILGELNRGIKTFESIQKNTGIDGKELDTILSDLEKKGLLKVVHKQGLLGPKIELYPTDKGFKEYYS